MTLHKICCCLFIANTNPINLRHQNEKNFQNSQISIAQKNNPAPSLDYQILNNPPRTSSMKQIVLSLICTLCLLTHRASAQEIDHSQSKLQSYIQTYNADYRALRSLYTIPLSKNKNARFRQLYKTWLTHLNKLPYNTLTQTEKIDYHLLKTKIGYHQDRLANQIIKDKQIVKLLPFAPIIIALEESRILRNPIKPQLAAQQLQNLIDQIQNSIDSHSSKRKSKLSLNTETKPSTQITKNASRTLSQLADALDDWQSLPQQIRSRIYMVDRQPLPQS